MAMGDTSRSAVKTETDLFIRVEEELRSCVELGLMSTDAHDLTSVWQSRLDREPQRFINDGYSINRDALRNFRRLQILVTDIPQKDPHKLTLANLLSGGRRGERRLLRECLAVLQAHGYDKLLRKYPCHHAGNPYVYHCQGLQFTHRWLKHIYFLGLMNKVLGSRLDKEFVALDIGSSYGIFSSLLKGEYPRSHHLLVDFPEQLILAQYFLGTCFPEAQIAGVKAVSKQEAISRDFVEGYDFVLVPCTLYDRITPGSADLVTNFASFGEMTRKWFEHYSKSPQLQGASYLFTANRVQSYPTYDTDVTILDYPIWNQQKRLHFGICPAFSGYYRYPRRRLFFFDRQGLPPYFEYIGEI